MDISTIIIAALTLFSALYFIFIRNDYLNAVALVAGGFVGVLITHFIF
jgi:uncharacterized MnhB-related membrane protein